MSFMFFYFIVQPDSTGMESSDFHCIVEDLDSYQNYKQATVINLRPSLASVQHIQETARRGLDQLFLLLSLLVKEIKQVLQLLP